MHLSASVEAARLWAESASDGDCHIRTEVFLVQDGCGPRRLLARGNPVRIESIESLSDRSSSHRSVSRSRVRYALHGLAIVDDVVEDRSGTLPMADRPGLSEALRLCLERGAGVLLVEEPTRLARDEYAAHDALRTFARSPTRASESSTPMVPAETGRATLLRPCSTVSATPWRHTTGG